MFLWSWNDWSVFWIPGYLQNWPVIVLWKASYWFILSSEPKYYKMPLAKKYYATPSIQTCIKQWSAWFFAYCMGWLLQTVGSLIIHLSSHWEWRALMVHGLVSFIFKFKFWHHFEVEWHIMHLQQWYASFGRLVVIHIK